MTESVLQGFGLGLSLILAIGAQNAFVLRQGLRRAHVFAVCLACALSDAVLIAAGVAGFGALAEALPWLEATMRYGGAAWLFVYGALGLRAAWRGGGTMPDSDAVPESLRRTLLMVLALSWLNPHVYLDTVVLIGTISAQFPDRLGFAIGAMTASFVFFFSLGYGARLLAPVFSRPRAQQILDVAIALVMWAIACKLLVL